jgi:hypothetical protein
MPFDLQVRSVSFRFNTVRYLRFRSRVLTASRAVSYPPTSSVVLQCITRDRCAGPCVDRERVQFTGRILLRRCEQHPPLSRPQRCRCASRRRRLAMQSVGAAARRATPPHGPHWPGFALMRIPIAFAGWRTHKSQGAGVAGPDLSLLIGRRVESNLVGPIPGRVLTEPATQRIEDCQALSHQASGHLAEPVGAVEDGQVCP